MTAAGVPCGPINTVDAGIALAREIALEPFVTAGDGAAGVATIRHPVTFSRTPPSYPCRRPRWTSTARDPRLARRRQRRRQRERDDIASRF